MTFALPAALLLSALALPILILYILKVRLRRMPVSTNLFWQQVYDEKPPRSIWQRLRHLLSLAAQLAILALLVLAIADPYLPWQLLQAQRIVLVMDNSASMRATDIAPSRLDVAKQRADALITGLRENDQLAIVLAGATPEVVVGMTGHIPTLRRAIEDLDASDNPTDLQPAVRLGRQLVGDHPHGQVIVLTDQPEPPGESEIADASPAEPPTEAHATADARVPVQWATIATERANNVGITELQARRSLVDPLGYEILVAVDNASVEPVRCRLEVTLDDVPVDILPLDLAPGQQWRRALEKTSIEGGTLVATLTKIARGGDDEAPLPADSEQPAGEDAAQPSDASEGEANGPGEPASPALNQLATVDVAWAVLPARKVQKVLIITPGNLFLRKVFEANPLIELEVRETFPEQWPSDAIIVLHQNVPETIPPGDVFVVDPQGDSDLWTLGDELRDPIITEQDTQSALMTHIRLDNVLVPQARRIEFSQPASTLAGTVSGDAIYAMVPRAGSRCLVLAVDLAESDLAFRTAFPIMVTNTLVWFSRESGELRPSQSTGSILAVELDGDDIELPPILHLRSPSGAVSEVAVASADPVTLTSEADETAAPAGGAEPSAEATAETVGAATPLVSVTKRCTLGPFDETGVWQLVLPTSENAMPDGEAEPREKILREIAVNLASSEETKLDAPEDANTAPVLGALGGGWLNRPIWFYLAMATCVLMAAEWWLYQRRVIT